jgi:ATP-binding cassette, subfamily B, bacterial
VAGTTLGLMIAFDWRLTLVALVLIPLVALPMRRAGRRVYAARNATQRKLAELTAYLQEVLGISGALLVKAFVRERTEQSRFRRTNVRRSLASASAQRRCRTPATSVATSRSSDASIMSTRP